MEDPSFFVDDIYVQDMIYALTIRSPIARGRLIEINAPELPDSYKLITSKSIPGKNSLDHFPIPILAETKLSYTGQPIALITGPEITKLEELVSDFEIITDEEDPVFIDGQETGDIPLSRNMAKDGIEQCFGEGAKIVSGSYKTGIQEHWYPEAHGAVAIPYGFAVDSGRKTASKKDTPRAKEESGTFIVYSPSQWPFHVKNSVAEVLGLNTGKVKVYPTCLASHLDGKIWYPSLIACHAALAALISGSPVKLMLTRQEDFIYSPKRNRTDIEIASSIGEKGEILGSSVKVKLDLGAEGIFEDEIIDQTCMGALGAYIHRSFALNCDGLRTNIPSQGPMAGFGISQGIFAAERHISHIADTLEQDPAEWRKQNYSDKNLAIGAVLKEKAPLAELIDSVTAMSDYHRKWASYELLRRARRNETWKFTGDPIRGIGISTGFQSNGFLHNDEGGNGNCAVELTLEKDGSLEIKTSINSAGYMETLKGLANDMLGVKPKSVKFFNTGEGGDSGAGTLSRNICTHAVLVERCCTAIKKLKLHNPLPITVKRSSKPAKEQLWVPDKMIDPEAFADPGWAASVVEVEINQITLEPKIRGVWLMVDGGRIISMRRSHLAIRTGTIQALGWACREQVLYTDGNISPELYRGYNITFLSEIPPIHVDFMRTNTENPKGIGDLPFCCVPAAYVQAVSQAMDHHFEKIPLNASDVLQAGKMKIPEPS